MKVIPYFMFEGTCEEALRFYQKAMGGDVVVVNRYDNPAMKAPEAYREKILHARWVLGNDILLYASDTFPGKPVAGTSGDVSISVVLDDDLEKTKRLFQALAEGGKVGIPFEKQFWGDWHGGLTDRYGFKWNINFEEPK